jgi:hypothetical protein
MMVRDMTARTDKQWTGTLVEAIQSDAPVSGYTHTFYRYPARFSPLFAREVISRFTRPGDIVLDPFMGGGTTLVEARSLGRRAVGSDVSSLAVFLAKTKTMLFTDSDRRKLLTWANSSALENLNLRNPVVRDEEWIESGYLRNLSGRPTWAIRKIVDLALGAVAELPGERQRMFARCAILRTAQWALDCRTDVPSAGQFRIQFLIFVHEMISGADEFYRACGRWKASSDNEPLCIHGSASSLDSAYKRVGLSTPRLVLTSPPYPGVHVLYHRWQIMGRRETPAPFWITGTKDGAGGSFYTFGDRHRPGLANYFDTALCAFKSIRSIVDKRTVVVQQVAFSDRRAHLRRYLRMMEDAGFQEIRSGDCNLVPGRIWRSVPNRKWYANKHGKTPSSAEVVLFHNLA